MVRQHTAELERQLARLGPGPAPSGDAARQQLTDRIMARRMTPAAMEKLLAGLARGPAVRTG